MLEVDPAKHVLVSLMFRWRRMSQVTELKPKGMRTEIYYHFHSSSFT